MSEQTWTRQKEAEEQTREVRYLVITPHRQKEAEEQTRDARYLTT